MNEQERRVFWAALFAGIPLLVTTALLTGFTSSIAGGNEAARAAAGAGIPLGILAGAIYIADQWGGSRAVAGLLVGIFGPLAAIALVVGACVLILSVA